MAGRPQGLAPWSPPNLTFEFCRLAHLMNGTWRVLYMDADTHEFEYLSPFQVDKRLRGVTAIALKIAWALVEFVSRSAFYYFCFLHRLQHLCMSILCTVLWKGNITMENQYTNGWPTKLGMWNGCKNKRKRNQVMFETDKRGNIQVGYNTSVRIPSSPYGDRKDNLLW